VRVTRAVETVVAVVLANLVLGAADGQPTASLDSRFGQGGKVITDLSGRYEEARALAIDAKGRIVAAGVAGTGLSQDFALARYNADGSLDGTFGSNGVVITDISHVNDAAWAVAIQGDDKILAAGVAGGDFALARYNVDGSADSRFGEGGVITTDFGGDDRANTLAVQRDGRIVVAGVANGLDFALARYQADGTPDPTFATNGTVVTDFSGGADAAFALALQADGMIVVAGSTGRFPQASFALARYAADGSLDTTFGTAGRTTVDFGRDARAHAVAVLPDGKIVTGGFVNNGSSGDGALTRHQANGTPDGPFGTAGKMLTDFGGRNFGSALTILADSAIVVGGCDDFPPYYDFAVARYQPDGHRDLTFSTEGTVLTEFGGNSWVNAVAVQADGKVVAAGYARTSQNTSADFALVRYNGDR
jgi:uncharacterized delta-60 repeat protein